MQTTVTSTVEVRRLVRKVRRVADEIVSDVGADAAGAAGAPGVPFVDTDVIIRLLTGDDPAKQASAGARFEAVEAGTLRVAAPVTVIADAVYVLASSRLYAVPRQEVRELLAPLVRLPAFEVASKRTVLAALDLYASAAIDFGDAMLVAAMRDARSEVLYSFDRDFDRLSGVIRRPPA